MGLLFVTEETVSKLPRANTTPCTHFVKPLSAGGDVKATLVAAVSPPEPYISRPAVRRVT